MKKLLAALTTITVAFTLMVPALQVSAQDYDPRNTFKLDDAQDELQLPGSSDLDEEGVRDTVANIIQILLGFIGLIAVLIILYGGFIWMTSAGNEDKVTKARATITAGIIGLAIIIVAYALTSFVVNIVYDFLDTPTTPSAP